MVTRDLQSVQYQTQKNSVTPYYDCLDAVMLTSWTLRALTPGRCVE
jgi:hypothetical protein